MKTAHLILLILTLFFSLPPVNAMTYSTEHGSEAEMATVSLLKALHQTHDLSGWLFTDKVHIDEKTIPHSHPVLSLHTRHTRKDQIDLLLSTYLHEQLHWHLDSQPDKTKAAIKALKKHYPEVPVGFPTGARNQYSTYLHLLVCYMELEALSELLSSTRVERASRFWQQDHYTWVYQTIEKDQALIAEVIQQTGLAL